MDALGKVKQAFPIFVKVWKKSDWNNHGSNGSFRVTGDLVEWYGQWLFLVPVKDGRWHIIHIINWREKCHLHIPLIYCLLGGYMLPTTFYGNQKQPLIWDGTIIPIGNYKKISTDHWNIHQVPQNTNMKGFSWGSGVCSRGLLDFS